MAEEADFLGLYRKRKGVSLSDLKRGIRLHLTEGEDRVKLWPDLVVLVQQLGAGSSNADTHFRSSSEVYTADASRSALMLAVTCKVDRMPECLRTDSAMACARRIVNCYALHHPHVQFFPLLGLTIICCLHVARLSEAQIYAVTVTIMNASTPVYMPSTSADEFVQSQMLRLFHQKYSKKSALTSESIFNHWIGHLFSLPSEHVVRLVDCYLCEGIKVLYRLFLALLSLCIKSAGGQEFSTYCRQFPHPFEMLIQTGIQLRRLSRARVAKLSQRVQQPETAEVPATAADILPVTCTGMSRIVTDDQLAELWPHLPDRVAVCGIDPWLAFATREHGLSLGTLYRLASPCQPSLMFVKTDQPGRVLGAYCSDAWRLSERCYGTGESFVFSFHVENGLSVYRWKPHSNDMFMFGQRDGIAIGGGGDGPAIVVDASLTRGRSHRSLTFANEPLISGPGAEFGVIDLEIISLGHAE